MSAYLTFLGTGTSMGVPVIGCSCLSCSSLDTKDKRLRTSVHVRTESASVVIDSGPDFRQQMLSYGIGQMDALIFTHEHKDHTAGMDDVRAYNFIQNAAVEVWASERVELALRHDYHYAFEEIRYPGVPEIKFNRIGSDTIFIGDLSFIPFLVYHHRLPVHAFRIGTLAYITDANHLPDEALEIINGVDILILNALRRTPHISHFTLDEAVEIAQASKARMTYLTHISHQMGTHKDVECTLPSNVRLAYDGLQIEFSIN